MSLLQDIAADCAERLEEVRARASDPLEESIVICCEEKRGPPSLNCQSLASARALFFGFDRTMPRAIRTAAIRACQPRASGLRILLMTISGGLFTHDVPDPKAPKE